MRRREEYQKKGFNPSVMKPILTRMSQDEFIAYALFFGQLANDSDPRSREYHLYGQLFEWCKRYYKKRFVYKRKK
jgi:hypothetical protein